MDIANKRIKKWIARGRQHSWLDLSKLRLTELPKLPLNVRRLNLSNNKLTSLEGIPTSVYKLYICFNETVCTLANLPNSLKIIKLGQMDNIKTLEELPDSIRTLYLYDMNGIVYIDKLPYNLKSYNAWHCDGIKKIHYLPPTLKYFNSYESAHLYSIIQFPDSVIYISLEFNKITYLHPFPKNLKKLYLMSCDIKNIPALPNSLEYCYITSCYRYYNQLINNMPIITNNNIISKYTNIKAIYIEVNCFCVKKCTEYRRCDIKSQPNILHSCCLHNYYYNKDNIYGSCLPHF